MGTKNYLVNLKISEGFKTYHFNIKKNEQATHYVEEFYKRKNYCPVKLLNSFVWIDFKTS